MMLLVQEHDVKQVNAIRERQFQAIMQIDGRTAWDPHAPQVESEGEPPCPCCGTAAPLVRGACSDCGLQLA